MRKILPLLSLIVFSINGNSQFNSTAPWLKGVKNQKELTYSENITLFNNYWKDKDPLAKSSGYKTFKRWEYFWQTDVTPSGYVISGAEILGAWQQKNKIFNKNVSAVPASNWQPMGPFTHTTTGSWSSGQGRVNIAAVDPSNSNTIYIGAPAGGIWKTTNAGTNWTPLTDNLPQIGVSGIAVDPTNSNTIYIVTGDRDSSNSRYVGVFKSTDGGTTWNITGTLTNVYSAGDIIIHPTNNQILWCATDIGIFRSSNGGTSWTNVRAGNFAQGNIRLKPTDPNTVYAISDSYFYVSTDGGTSFTSVTTNLPTNPGRMLLDVTPADKNYIYILATDSSGLFDGIYRSTNSGTSWTKTSTASTTDPFGTSRQAFYDLALAVSPTNRDEIYTGCLEIYKSTDGGSDFTQLNDWSSPSSASYTHADIHYLQFFGNSIYACTDGGVYVSNNGGTDFTSKTAGLQIGQFYKIAVNSTTTGKMVGGLQDNGGYALSGGTWKNYYGADGMDTEINGDKCYGFIQYGGTLYVSNNGGSNISSYIQAPMAETGTNDDGGNWVTPLAMDSSGNVFAGYSKLYKLGTSNWAAQSSSTIGTGDIDVITIAPSNKNNIFVSNESELYRSTDGGVNFTKVYTAGNKIVSICVHTTDPSIVYVTVAGTTNQVYKSTNSGSTFTLFNQNLPSTGATVVAHQTGHPQNPLYVGTSLGVYYRDDSMTQWEPFDTNLPNVRVTDLVVNTTDKLLIASTYGRGVWKTSLPQYLSTEDFELQKIGVYPNPSTGIFNLSIGDKEIKEIEVFDILGKSIFKVNNNIGSNYALNLSNSPNGVYFVKISSNGGQAVKRILKN